MATCSRITSLDPKQGVQLYTVDAPKGAKPDISRRDDCLQCHQGPATLGVPGLMVSSIHPRTAGTNEHGSSFVTDDRTPFADRWGGWYFTGSSRRRKQFRK